MRICVFVAPASNQLSRNPVVVSCRRRLTAGTSNLLATLIRFTPLWVSVPASTIVHPTDYAILSAMPPSSIVTHRPLLIFFPGLGIQLSVAYTAHTHPTALPAAPPPNSDSDLQGCIPEVLDLHWTTQDCATTLAIHSCARSSTGPWRPGKNRSPRPVRSARRARLGARTCPLSPARTR